VPHGQRQEGETMNGLVILIVVLLVIFIFVMGTYNRLVSCSNRVKEAFATMDVYLKKRWDLIPNLVNTVRGYADFEKSALTEITGLRTKNYSDMSSAEKTESNEKLTAGLARLFAVAEAYPELKANASFLDLSSKLDKIEEDIANARKYYNAEVRNYNDQVQMFPGNIFAPMFGFSAEKMFETAAEERENVSVSFDAEGKSDGKSAK